MKVYIFKNCSTCVKAIKFLKKSKAEFMEIDIISQPPTKKELTQMLKFQEGELKKMFNASGQVYRKLKIKDRIKTMSKQEAILLLSQNGKLIKRPFLINENKGLVGFDEEQWKTLF